MYPTIAKYVFFYPIRYLRGEFICPLINKVKQIETYDENDIEKYQIERINNVLSYCKENIPFYRNNLPNKMQYKKYIKSYEDMQNVPVIDKKLYIKEIVKCNSLPKKRVSKRSTSGSTGEPLIFYKERIATAFMDAVMYHTYSWHDIKIGDKQARFWGMPVKQQAKAKEQLKDFFMNRTRFSAFNLEKETMMQYYYHMLKFRPNYCYGYPSLIYEFASFMKANNLSFKALNLKGVILTGEMLLPERLGIIEEIFSAKTINEYGCTEIGVIGFQCKHNKMHVMSHNVYLEVLSEGIQVYDEEGDLYVTELNSNYMPFIRYKLGDRGIITKERCECGVHFPVIKSIKGRVDDFVITPDGRKIYDAIFAYTLKRHVKSFLVIQKRVELIEIYIVRDQLYSENTEKEYLNILHKALGDGIKLQVFHVDELPRESSGKLRYFRSEVSANKQVDTPPNFLNKT